ncbi:RNA-binding protein [Mesoplasma entomophilum]|nr:MULTISPECIES: ASCH domain-containing protein [Mesoplasma]AVN60338.1 RNA-binding protein [Mesoplasma entomophilum]AVN62355.1 RNA-binding protein [Mesoplasma coleopterae]AVN63043.1 RNA-binding protein [Mesoplasma coleopterae]
MKMEQKIREYWEKFKLDTNADQDLNYKEDFCFGYDERTYKELLKLVLEGKKKATSSALFQYEKDNEEEPRVGDYAIVTDSLRNPKCIIKTTNVRYIKFNEMNYDICKLEGEDENLESWKEEHRTFFTSVFKRYNLNFTEDMDILFEEFEVVYR